MNLSIDHKEVSYILYFDWRGGYSTDMSVKTHLLNSTLEIRSIFLDVLHSSKKVKGIFKVKFLITDSLLKTNYMKHIMSKLPLLLIHIFLSCISLVMNSTKLEWR